MVEGDEIARFEPYAVGVAAIHSPHTAIVDFGEVARNLAADLRADGVQIRTGCDVGGIRQQDGRVQLGTSLGMIEVDEVVSCAGLGADRVARLAGDDDDPRIVPFRGEYWKLRPDRRYLVRGLIYPVPDPAFPFLGVHLTSRVDGEVLLGPNAVLAFAREGYRWRDVGWRDLVETLSWPGFRKLASRYWRAGVDEMLRSASRSRFVAAARTYVPELREEDVVRAEAGVRAQAVGLDGDLVDDFSFSTTGRVLSVRNAPSPAATSSLAIAERVVDELERLLLSPPHPSADPHSVRLEE